MLKFNFPKAQTVRNRTSPEVHQTYYIYICKNGDRKHNFHTAAFTKNLTSKTHLAHSTFQQFFLSRFRQYEIESHNLVTAAIDRSTALFEGLHTAQSCLGHKQDCFSELLKSWQCMFCGENHYTTSPPAVYHRPPQFTTYTFCRLQNNSSQPQCEVI